MSSWTDTLVLDFAKSLLRGAGLDTPERLTVHNFSAFFGAIQDVVRDMSADKRAGLSSEWATRLHRLADDFSERVRLDPLLVYAPRTTKHLAFHKDPSFIRHLPAANAVGKTLAEYIEAYWQMTGQRHYNQPGNVVLLATGHSVYSLDVFQRKILEGEDHDPYSPYIPEDGYWFHSYDRRAFTVRIACQSCAEKRRPKQCTHGKAFKCLSADSGVGRLMGFTAPLGISDEQTPADTWNELVQRVIRVKGRMIVGATPLGGLDHWTTKLIEQAGQPEFAGVVSGHNISKLDCIGSAGGPSWDQIQKERKMLSKTEFAVRVLGRVVALGDSIFNLALLDTIEKAETREPERGLLTTKKSLADVQDSVDVSFVSAVDGPVVVWERPDRRASYCIGSDIAAGLKQDGTDASCSYVFKVTPGAADKPALEMVAAIHCRQDVFSYAAEIKKLAVWYREALVIPEVNGIGAAFLTDLKRHHNYNNIFTEEVPAEYVEDGGIEPKMGVSAGEVSKPAMIAALAWYLNNRQIIIRDAAFLSECRTYQRITRPNGMFRYGAAPGAHDDRVMAAALAAYACSIFPDQVDASLTSPESEEPGPPPPRKNYDPFGLAASRKEFKF